MDIETKIQKVWSGYGTFKSITLPFLVLLVIITKLKRQREKSTSENNEAGAQESSVRGLEAIPQVGPLFPWPFIGNIPLLLPISKVIANIERRSQAYGDLCKFMAFNENFVILNSAPLAQTLLKSTEFGHQIKDPILYDMKPFVQNSVLVSTGKFWQAQRKILMRSQNFSSLKSYVKMVNKHCVRFVEELDNLFQDRKSHQINDNINEVFLKIITEMITGVEIKSAAEINDYHHNFQIWKECVLGRIVYRVLYFKIFWRLGHLSKKYDQAVDGLINFAKRMIQEHKESRNQDLKGLSQVKSVLDDLIEAGVDEKQMVDEINTMLFGGHETGASAIHCFCFMMALHPEIQRECRKEVDELFNKLSCGDDNGANLSYESVQRELKYLERCLLETLRLFPPIFLILRKLNQPLDIEHSGEKIKLPQFSRIPFIETKSIIQNLPSSAQIGFYLRSTKGMHIRFLHSRPGLEIAWARSLLCWN